MNFLEEAINKLIGGQYYTSEKITKFIAKEKMKTIIGNPPFKQKKKK